MGIWTEKQMRESCAELLFEHETLLSDMAEANILVNHEHWYRWPNYCLPLCAGFEGWSSADKKISYYKNVKEKAVDEAYFEGEEIIWELLYQEDCEYFKKYILVPTARNIYEEIFLNNKNWQNDFIEFLGYEYEFKGNEIIGSTSAVHDSFLLLETYLQLDLCEEIASVFDEKNINILREKKIIGSNADRISSVLLEEMNIGGLLAELGIDKKLEQARRVIYECQKEEIYE